MTKLNKITVLLASVAFAGAVFAAPSTNASDNWVSGHGNVQVKDSFGDCWRNSVWTPATAAAGCGAVVAQAKQAEAVVAPAEVKPVVNAQKVTLAADAYFDYDKSVVKAEGKAKLYDLAAKIANLNLETLVATGHTDSRGTDKYNQALSLRRANAVKAYLVSKGIAADRILVEGKGESELAVSPEKTAADYAANRRVIIEVVGTAK